MTSEGHRKRLSRIRRRAIPEIVQSFERGEISARRADTLLYLEPDEQRARLSRILAEREALGRRSKLATQIIKAHIDAGERDLAALREDLRVAFTRLPLENISKLLEALGGWTWRS